MRILSASVFLLAMSGVAAASATAASSESEWAGPYVGIGPSTAQVSASTAPYNYQIQQLSGIVVAGRNIIIVPGTTRPAGDSARANGALGTVHAGYAWQSGHFVWGLEGDYGTGGGAGTSTTVQQMNLTALAAGATLTSQRSVALGSSSALRARLGFAARRDLVYVTGGPAQVNVTITGVDSLEADPTRTVFNGPCPGSFCRANFLIDSLNSRTSQRQNHTGTVLGVGWAHRASRWTVVALEYTRTSLGSRNYALNDALVETCSMTVPNAGTCIGSPSDPALQPFLVTQSPHSFNVTTSSLNLRLDVRLR